MNVHERCGAHIFLLNAVISREALIMRSRRSWCSSRLSRNFSNMGMNGDAAEGDVCVASKGCFSSAMTDKGGQYCLAGVYFQDWVQCLMMPMLRCSSYLFSGICVCGAVVRVDWKFVVDEEPNEWH